MADGGRLTAEGEKSRRSEGEKKKLISW